MQPPSDVDLFELVEAGEDASAGDAPDDVDAAAAVERAGALVLDDLPEAVPAAVVLDLLAGSHHHPPLDGVDGVGRQTGSDGHGPTQQKVVHPILVVGAASFRIIGGEQDGLERVVKAKVKAAVDEDAEAGDDEAAVKAAHAVRLDGLDVHVDDALELPLVSGVFGVHGESGASVVDALDEEEGERSGAAAAQHVLGQLLLVGGALAHHEDTLDLVLEGKVERLLGKIPDHTGHVSPPKGRHSFVSECFGDAVLDAVVAGGQLALLDQFVLVLEEELDSLDGSGAGLGHRRRAPAQHEALGETQLVTGRRRRLFRSFTHLDCVISVIV